MIIFANGIREPRDDQTNPIPAKLSLTGIRTRSDKMCHVAFLTILIVTTSYYYYVIIQSQDNVFDWDERQQNTVKGAFFWLHMVLQIPGGLLAQKYGAKSIFGFSNGVVALLTCAIPFSAKLNFEALLVLRLVQGLIAGVAWPSMQAMTGKWIPPHERSRFVSAYFGTCPTHLQLCYCLIIITVRGYC